MKHPDRVRFGMTIKQLRLAKGYTQEALAARAALHHTYVGGVERGERNVSLDNILKLARALDEYPSTLFADFQV